MARRQKDPRIRGGILSLIEWAGQDRNLIVYKFPNQGRQINRGSKLTVREGQAAIFCLKGRMADVFPPGFYDIDTGNIPLLTRLLGWKYGFQSPFEVDIYFVQTTQFTNFKWGTTNPIMINDAQFGPVKVRGHGAYSFRVDDPFKFLTELSGTSMQFTTQEITDYLRSKVLMSVTAAVGQANLPVMEMASNLMKLSEDVEVKVREMAKDLGILITRFIFESFSLPEELQKAMLENTALGMRRQNFDMHLAQRQMDVMGKAASNQGTAGGMMGMGMGMGMGVGMGGHMGGMFGQGMQNVAAFNPQNSTAQSGANAATCPHCKKPLASAAARFCGSCGKSTATGESCPKCNKPVKSGARFCGECGQSMVSSCTKCNKPLKAGAKFCGECGTPQ